MVAKESYSASMVAKESYSDMRKYQLTSLLISFFSGKSSEWGRQFKLLQK